MGYSGLIYAAIVAAWAAFLVPRWVRRNEEVEQAAETDAARGVRVLQRRTHAVRAGHARPGSTVLHGRADGLVVGAASHDDAEAADGSVADAGDGHDALDPVSQVDAAFARAAQRRRRLLVVLVAALAGAIVAVTLGYLPGVVPWVLGGALAMFLFAARRAAVAQSARRRVALRRAAAMADRLAEAEADTDDAEDDVPLTADGKRIAVYEPPVLPEVDPNAWEPVAVPRPTYLDKAVAAPPPARSIDLSAPGAWTSGRLDPAGSIELPPQRRQPIAAAPPPVESDSSPDEEEYSDHRRAVGD